MAIDQQRVRNVLRNDARFIDIDVVDVINNVDATALAGICWLDNPYILLALMLFELLVVVIKIAEFIR